MTTEKGRLFGRVAELYDQYRPAYPDAAVEHVLALCDRPPTALLEIGAGTGKATVSLARLRPGLAITCVEPDAAMAAVAQRNVPAARVHVSMFEDWPPPPEPYDLAVSAQAWHWVDHAVAIPKLAAMLRPGGAFAILANIPRDGGHDLRAVLDPVYDRWRPGSSQSVGIVNWDGQLSEQAQELRDSGAFEVRDLWHTDWDEVLSADDFSALHLTHSDTLIMDEADQPRFVEALRHAVDQAGGTVTMRYRTVVLAAIRR